MKILLSARPGFLPVLALGLALSGCVTGTQREGRPIGVDDVAGIEIGKTTRQQVLDRFGPPTSLQAPESFRGPDELDGMGAPSVPRSRTDRDVYVYHYWEDHEKFFSFVLLYTWYRRVRLTDTLMVGFDAAGVVEHVAFARQTESGE